MSQADHHYRPDIDGLRAAAVTFVLAFHAFPARLPGGFVGVDVFFVISGYLISGIILAAIADRRFTFSGFYARRIRRIFPALAVLLAAVLTAGWFYLYADDYARLGRHVAAGAAFVSNIAFWQEASYFDIAADLKPLLHLWSLGVEEQFYFVWPVLLVIASRWRRGPLAMTFAIGTLSFLVAIWTVRIDRTPAFYAPWNRFWELLAGAMLACVEADDALRSWLRAITSRATIANAAAVLGSIAIVAGVVLIDSTRVFPGLWVMLPVGGAFLLMLAGPHAWINRAILSHPLVVFVGLISYPLYLWHWPLLSFAHIRYGGIPPTWLRLGLLALSVALAWATYQFIEKPIRFGARQGPIGRVAVPGLAVAVAVLCAAGFAVFKDGGVLDRRVNRNEAARLVDYYERVRTTQLGGSYRLECDFMDVVTGKLRDTLDPSCTQPGRDHTVFLWGDSYAQSLSQGLRDAVPAGTAVAQVATSACRAEIENFDESAPEHRCEKANRYAMAAIERLRPDVVIIAQAGAHAETDWRAITSRALALGARHVIVVGPFPLWYPGLPRIYAEHHMEDRAEYVSNGVNMDVFKNDQAARARVSGLAHVTYLSLLERLCHDGACLARVPGEDELELMALDFGHLSPRGSSYLGRAVWPSFLEPVLR